MSVVQSNLEQSNSEQSNNGILLIDKPSGMSSMRVLTLVKYLSSQGEAKQDKVKKSKVGHCGTLDPLASGLMVVLLGTATKQQNKFLSANKSYSGTIKLGLTTNTDDIVGEVLEENDLTDLFKKNSKEESPNLILEKIRKEFSGTSMQTPPDFSAIKVAGKRSYSLARKGKSVELKQREVEINFEDLRFHNYDSIRFELNCTKGTYIRSLARDIGEFLGCGACISSLRRTASNPFSLEQAYSLDQVKDFGLNNCLILPEDVQDLDTFMIGNSELPIQKVAN